MVDTVGQYRHIQQEIDAAIREVLETGAYINGPAVQRFAANLSAYMGGAEVIPCANGTDALQAALMALELQPGDEVITPAFTYIATVEVMALLRLRPVFVDVDPDTFNLDITKTAAAIGPRTRAIMPVHLFGQPADMAPLMELAAAHGLYVIEDTAQALGSEYVQPEGQALRAGAIGHIGCTSFYPSKNLGAFGDGGALFCRDAALAARLRMVCNHGQSRRYYHDIVGMNSRLDSIQAAILDVKLRHLDAYTAARRAAAAAYDAQLRGAEGLTLPVVSPFARHVWHQYTVRISGGRARRDAVKDFLDKIGVPSMIYYPVACHLQEAFRDLGYKPGDFPIAEQLSEEVLSLPMHSELNEAQVTRVSGALLDALKQTN